MDEVAKQQILERELMLAYQENDQQAFRTLYQLYADRVYGFIIKKVGKRELADELYQIVFERVHSKRHLYRPDIPVGAWIFTLTKNIVADNYRSEKSAMNFLRKHSDQYVVQQQLPADHPEIDLSPLNLKEKEIVSMRYWQDLDFEEIASSLGLTHSNVRKVISRALAKLRGSEK